MDASKQPGPQKVIHDIGRMECLKWDSFSILVHSDRMPERCPFRILSELNFLNLIVKAIRIDNFTKHVI